MATVDDRVVAMSFENSRFESAASRTLGTLGRLREALKFSGASKGLSDVQSTASRFSLGGMSSALDSIRGKFSAMSIAATAALATVVSRAVSAGLQFARSFTIRPLTDGLAEYETNLGSVQTILANTQAAGTRLKDVNAALLELNQYSDRTIYNFGEMARNIGTFTAAGVDLDTSVASIKGISNLAAISGSNSQQAATAMYQLSQAISAGKVGLQDWNSVVNAGMGGTIFQRALAQTAVTMGTIKEESLRLEGPMRNVTISGRSFRESIMARPGERSWLSSDVLTATLRQFTGDMTDAELATMGFTREQIRSIQTQAETAQKAATQVKTLRGVIDTAREASGSGWSQTWQIIFGDFGEAKNLFTETSNAVNGFIAASAEARNKVLGDWKELGGRTALIESIKNVFQALRSVITPIKEAFREFFPATTGRQLYDLTVRLRNFTETLRIGPETANNLKRTFSGFFAVLDLGRTILKGVLGVIGDLLGTATDGSGGFLRFTGNIGDWLVAINKAIRDGTGLTRFFDGLTEVLSVPIRLFADIREAVTNLFGDFGGADSRDVTESLNSMGEAFNPLEELINSASDAWDNFLRVVDRAMAKLQPVIAGISDLFSGLGRTLGDALSSADFNNVMEVIQTGLLGGIFLLIKRFFSNGLNVDLGGGILGNLSDSFETLTGTLTALQQNIKADTLMKIAIAIGVLTASVVALSFVDSRRLQVAMTALAVGFGQLLGAMAILTSLPTAAGFLKVPIIAASLILLAGAVNVLVIAVYALSRLSWEELARGLAGVAGLLTGISAAAIPLSKNSAGLASAGVGIIAIAIAMKILASAVSDFGNMDWESIAKGIASVTASLVAIGGAAKLFPIGMPAIGLGLIAVGFGLKVVASSVSDFATMDWETLGKGLASVAASLLAIAGAMTLMPPTMLASAAGLVLVALALQGITRAVKSMGTMQLDRIGKGLATLAGSMAILAAGLHFMQGSLPGAAALVVATLALGMLVPVIKSLGNMSWEEIGRGLVALAASMAILGAAGLLLAPVAPALLAFGVAILAIGGGLALAGLGLSAIAAGISALVVSGPAGVKILVQALTSLASAIPTIATTFILGVVRMARSIAEAAPEFVEAIGKILANLAEAVIVAAPKLAEAMSALLQAGLRILRDNAPTIIATGLLILTNLLRGIADNIGKVTSAVGTIIVRFLGALSDKLPQILAAGANLLVRLLEGIANNLPRVTAAAGKLVVAFLSGIANNLAPVLAAGSKIAVRLVEGIANHAQNMVAAGGKLIGKFLEGIGSLGEAVARSAVTMVGKFILAAVRAALAMVAVAARAVIYFLEGLTLAVETYGPQLNQAGWDLAIAIIKGMLNAIRANAGVVIDALKGVAGDAIGGVKSIFGINSPSRVFAEIGGYLIQGLAKGIGSDSGATDAVYTLANGIINGFRDIFQIRSPSQVMQEIGEFVGEGFARGLRGSSEDVSSAYSDLSRLLTDAMITAQETIATEQDKLNKLLAESRPDKDAIAEAQNIISDNQIILQKSSAARKELIEKLKDERTELQGVARAYEKVAEQLRRAKERLEEAVKTRDDAARSIFDSFSRLPEFGRRTIEIPGLPDFSRSGIVDDVPSLPDLIGDDDDIREHLNTYIRSVSEQAAALRKYKATLDQLRGLGLSDIMYQTLLDEGVSGQKFADELLIGGQAAVAGVNNLAVEFLNSTRALEDASRSLAGSPDHVGAYLRSLNDEAAAMEQYKATLDQLRAMGLGDVMYKNLLDQGISGQEFASQLLSGGTNAVNNVNALSDRFANAQRALTDASTALSTSPDQLGPYRESLREHAAAVEKYKQTLDALRRLGLNDATYRQLLDAGVSGQEFASQLLAGGQPAVNSINALNRRIVRASRELARSSSTSLYQAGVDAAEGLVRGLRDRRSRIRRVMEGIATDMIQAIRDKLGIRSPSKEFEALGLFSTEGLAKGLRASSRVVVRAAENIGQDALIAMRDSMAAVSNFMASEIDPNPVITPVLDLSNIQRNAQLLGEMTDVTPITAALSYGQASVIAASRASQASQTAEEPTVEPNSGSPIVFEQHNHSPEALSTSEIYRQTKNQLSQAASMLQVNT